MRTSWRSCGGPTCRQARAVRSTRHSRVTLGLLPPSTCRAVLVIAMLHRWLSSAMLALLAVFSHRCRPPRSALFGSTPVALTCIRLVQLGYSPPLCAQTTQEYDTFGSTAAEVARRAAAEAAAERPSGRRLSKQGPNCKT